MRRAARGQAFFGFFHNTLERPEHERSVDFVKHVPGYFLTLEYPGVAHHLKVPGDHGSILGKVLRNGCDIGRSVDVYPFYSFNRLYG